MLVADLQSGTPQSVATTVAGVTIVGDENELFYVNADDGFNQYVVRARPAVAGATAMSFPRVAVQLFGVDDTYVYWREQVYNTPPVVRRATRAGDGSDVETLAVPDGGQIFAGYFWNIECASAPCTLRRTPTSGGITETVATIKGNILGASADRLYIGDTGEQQTIKYRVVDVAADGTMHVLTDYLPYEQWPYHVVVSGSDLFWAGVFQVYELSSAGGVPAPVSGTSGVNWPFVVTDSEILYDFNSSGYRTLPR